jgi:hypothetical protein
VLLNFTATNSPTVVVDTAAKNFKYRFYRVADVAALTQNTPVMNLFRAGNNVVVTWPTNSTGFTLEYKTNLSAVSWTTNAIAPVVVNGSYMVTNPISTGARYYRLKR